MEMNVWKHERRAIYLQKNIYTIVTANKKKYVERTTRHIILQITKQWGVCFQL